VVIDGDIATVSIEFAVESAGAAVPIPVSLTNPASDADKEKLETLRAKLSSVVRTSFASNTVRVDGPAFTSTADGDVTANVRAMTQAATAITSTAFTSGVTSLEKNFEPEVGAHIRTVIGGQPLPKVTAQGSGVRLGAGALSATPAEAAEEDGEQVLTKKQQRAARAISAIGLVVISAFVVAFLYPELWQKAAIGAVIGIGLVIAIWMFVVVPRFVMAVAAAAVVTALLIAQFDVEETWARILVGVLTCVVVAAGSLLHRHPPTFLGGS
jgi:hypothetical protein